DGAGDPAAKGAEPVRVDLLGVDTRRLVRIPGRIDEQVVGPFVPVLAEGRAAHADDRDAVLDAVACHGGLLARGYSAARVADATRPVRGCRPRTASPPGATARPPPG